MIMLEVKKKNGKLVNFANDDDVAQFFLDFVPDNVMRSILFDTLINDEPEAEDVSIEGYGVINIMKRILNAAYVIAFCRWKQLLDSKSDWAEADDDGAKYFDNARFTKLFQSALLGEDITLDLQVFSLLELWVALKKAPVSVNTRFLAIFDYNKIGDKVGVILQSVRDAIKNATFKGGNYSGKYTKEYCNELCTSLLMAFAVFQGTSVTYPADNRLSNDDFMISYRMMYDTVELYPNTIFLTHKLIASEQQLRLMNGENGVRQPARLVLYLCAETSAFNGKYQYRYNSFDSERQTHIQTDVLEEEPKEATSIRDIHETRKFLSFSYKNIREFAMVLNDSIKKSSAIKSDLLTICGKSYPTILAGGKVSIDDPNIYWDNVITLMLLEMGVSEFLERILRDESIFTEVLENISWRKNGKRSISGLKREYEGKRNKINATCGRRTEICKKQQLELRITTVLKAMSFDIDDDDDKNPFLESLSLKYNKIVACIDMLNGTDISAEDLKSNIGDLEKIFKDIFMFLQIFYVGLDGYAIELMEANKNKLKQAEDSETDPDVLSKQREDMRQEWYNAFEKAAKAKLAEIKDQSLTQLFDGFCDLCASYNTFSKEGKYDISDKAKRLKYVITRNYICDAKKLRHFATVITADGEEITIFEVLGNSLKYYSDKDGLFYEWLNYLRDIFLFLIYNEDYNCRSLWKSEGKVLEDKDCDPVYPYIVTYYKENIDRDNVKKCTYRVPIPTVGSESDANTVTLLTDEEYTPQTYYCIPLRFGSSERWWINPFLIPKSLIKRIGYPEPKKKN